MIPHTTMELLENLSLAGLTLLFSILVGKVISRVLKSFKEDIKTFFQKLGVGEVIANFLIKGTEYFIYFIGVLLSLSQFGFSTYLLQLLVFLTVLATIVTFLFSLRKLLKNAAAGIYLARKKELKKGSELEFNSHEGKVIEKGLLSITLETGEEKIIIPNSLLIDKEIKKVN